MRTIYLTLLLFVLTLISAYAQKDKMKGILDDEMELIENDKQTLRFFDAKTGNVLPGATIKIKNIGEYTTDSEGKIHFPNQPDGYLNVRFEKEGYISSDFDVEIVADMIFFNRFSMSPKLEIGSMRIVLDWTDSPSDLDAHIVKENIYHISYQHTKVLSDGTGRLDRDDMDGYGPETITISDIDDNAKYEYFVHNWTDRNKTNSQNLSTSKATIKIFANNEFIGKVEVPKGIAGTTWSVFKIINGEFKVTNEIRQ